MRLLLSFLKAPEIGGRSGRSIDAAATCTDGRGPLGIAAASDVAVFDTLCTICFCSPLLEDVNATCLWRVESTFGGCGALGCANNDDEDGNTDDVIALVSCCDNTDDATHDADVDNRSGSFHAVLALGCWGTGGIVAEDVDAREDNVIGSWCCHACLVSGGGGG